MKKTRVILVAALIALVGAFVAYSQLRAAPAPPTSGAGRGPLGASASAGRHEAPIAVVTDLAGSEDVPITRQYVGWVEPVAAVDIRTRVDGVIVEKDVAEGQSVKTGDLLFKLDARALQAVVAKDEASITKDQASLDQLNADLTRLQDLLGHSDVTKQQVEQQQALVNEGKATVADDKAQLQADQVQLSYATLTAPIDGRVGVINDTVGAVVHISDQTPLLTITQMAPLRVRFSAPEADLAAIRQALAAPPGATTRAIDPTTGKTLAQGLANFVDSAVDTASGTVTVQADFANADGALWPGEYVNVEVDLGVHRDATVVPLAAVQLNGQSSYVFLARPDGTVSQQPVEVAASVGDLALIQSGVRPGDHVVVEGQLRLTDGAPIKETLASAAPATPPGTAGARKGS